MKKTTLFFLGLCLSVGLTAQNTTKLTDLNLANIWQEYGTPTVEQLGINKEDTALRLHAKSILKIKLDRGSQRFETLLSVPELNTNFAEESLIVQPLVNGTKLYFKKDGDSKRLIGVTGTSGNIEKGSVEFIFKGDGKEIYNSGVIRAGDAPKPVNIDLSNIHLLEIELNPTQDGPSGDYALLVNPNLTYKSVEPILIEATAMGKGPEQSKEVSQHLSSKLK